MLLYFVLFCVLVKAQTPCDRYRSVFDCGTLLTQGDCVLASVVFPYPSSPAAHYKCLWSGSCVADTALCKPSCFISQKVSSCGTNYYTCPSNSFQGGFGDSALCTGIPNPFGNGGVCALTYCSYSCTGSTLTPTCTGLSEYGCETFYYRNSSGDFNCKRSGTACVASQKCIQYCTGTSAVANCSSLTQSQCASRFVNIGGLTYNCGLISGSCQSTSLCFFEGASTCTGATVVSNCVGLTQAVCPTRRQNSGGKITNCYWNINDVTCRSGKSCY